MLVEISKLVGIVISYAIVTVGLFSGAIASVIMLAK